MYYLETKLNKHTGIFSTFSWFIPWSMANLDFSKKAFISCILNMSDALPVSRSALWKQ